MREYTRFVCHDCGKKFGTTPVNPGATWHIGKCESCLAEDIPCTSSSDYGFIVKQPDSISKPKELSDLVDPILANFDFHRVHSCMKTLNWKWYMPSGEYSIPSIDRMKEVSRNLLINVVKSKEYEICGSGGFYAEKTRDNLLSIHDGLILRFVLEESELFFGDPNDVD